MQLSLGLSFACDLKLNLLYHKLLISHDFYFPWLESCFHCNSWGRYFSCCKHWNTYLVTFVLWIRNIRCGFLEDLWQLSLLKTKRRKSGWTNVTTRNNHDHFWVRFASFFAPSVQWVAAVFWLTTFVKTLVAPTRVKYGKALKPSLMCGTMLRASQIVLVSFTITVT